MYADSLSGSTVSMLNRFMEATDEEYMIITDRFHLKGYDNEYYFSFVLGRLLQPLSEMKMMHSNVIMSDLKKATGKHINIELEEKILREDRLYLVNISLPVYALLRKCFYLLQEHVDSLEYERLIKFEMPIDINAQCDNRGGYSVFQYYGETCTFPLIGIVPFENSYTPYKYDYNTIKL